MSVPTLRPYQLAAIEAVERARRGGRTRVLVVMPTGTGKTTLFGEIARREHEAGRGSLVLAHRDELLTQAAERLSLMIPDARVGVEGGPRRTDGRENVVIAGVQTVGRASTDRLDWFRPSLMVIDEAHHAAAASYQTAMRRFGAFAGDCFTVGVTATDHRLDNKRLSGESEGTFEECVYRLSVREAMEDGWLCGLRGYRVQGDADLSGVKTTAGDYNVGQLARAVNTPEQTAVALRHWRERAADRRTVVFCVDVAHAKAVADAFSLAGVAAESVDGGMRPADRDGAMARFRTGETQVLVNCELITEGVDVPECACVLLLRPTKSWSLFTQMVGRGLRILEGKADCVVLDVVDATADHRLDDRPGVAGLLGMPSRLDLKGRKALDALADYEALTDGQKGMLSLQPGLGIDGAATVATGVDLLAPTALPPEIQALTPHAWTRLHEGLYRLRCGNGGPNGNGNGQRNRTITLTQDVLGDWLVRATADDGLDNQARRDDLATAIKAADNYVRRTWPDAARIVATGAAWRERPPSDKQTALMKKLAKRHGVPSEAVGRVATMGEAGAFIDRLIAAGDKVAA